MVFFLDCVQVRVGKSRRKESPENDWLPRGGGWFSRARGPPTPPRSLSNDYHTLRKWLASSPACSHLMLVGALLLSFFCMEIPQSSLASSVRSNQVSKHPSARPATVSYKTAQLRGVTRRLRKIKTIRS